MKKLLLTLALCFSLKAEVIDLTINGTSLAAQGYDVSVKWAPDAGKIDVQAVKGKDVYRVTFPLKVALGEAYTKTTWLQHNGSHVNIAPWILTDFIGRGNQLAGVRIVFSGGELYYHE